MARRALRILPLYLLVLLGLAPFFWAGRFWQPLETAAYGLLFVYNFIPKEMDIHYLSHLWSLGVEEQFYLFWPLAISLLALRQKWLLTGCSMLIALCWLRMTSGYGAEISTHSPGRWTIPAIYPIIIGAMLAIAVRHPRLGRGAKRMASSLWSPLLAGALLALPLLTSERPVEVEMLGAGGIGLIVVWIYLNQHRSIVKSMDWGPIGYLGLISYGIYMWQGVLTGNGPYRQLPYWPPDPMVGALLTLPAAMLSYHLMEAPILRLKRLFSADRPKPEPTTPEGSRVS